MSEVQYCGRALELTIQSVVFAVGPLPLTSTSRPPRIHRTSVTHVMNETRPSPLFAVSSASVYYTERKPKNKKRGRPGNEATEYTQAYTNIHEYT